MCRRFLPQLLAMCVVLTTAVHGRAQDRSLAAWLEQVWPEVEKTLGSPLPKPPRLELAAAGTTADPDAVAYLRGRFPHLQGDALVHAVADAGAVYDSASVARLVEGSNLIQLRPKNQQPMARWNARLGATADPEFLKLALLHEAVKYALDARYGLARRRQACRDLEEWLAWQAVVEGRAQFITRRLASGLGMEKWFPLLAERFLYAPDVSPDPALRTTSQAAMRQMHWAYTRGCEFWRFLDEQRLPDVEKTVLARPPRLTQWIDNPELYLQSLKSGRSDLAQTMTRLESLSPAGEWQAAQQAWTPEMVRLWAEKLGGKEAAEKRLEVWLEGRTLLWTPKDNSLRFVTLSVARFQTPAAARAFLGCSLDLQRKADERSPSAHSQYRDVSLSGADVAVLNQQPGPCAMLRACVADLFLEISWYGMAPDTTWAQGLVREIAKR
jgi:hypothetical protein